MRAQKQTNVYTQTDAIPTKLMREAEINVQNDLIETMDKEITTDGSISIKPSDGSCKFFHKRIFPKFSSKFYFNSCPNTFS